jgi:thiamine-monophosphate kinase
VLIVCGAIGDGWLGLKAARGEPLTHAADLANHYRLPRPLLGLRDALRAFARACADVSDGLIADASHIGDASEVGLEIALENIPLSPGGSAWLAGEADRAAALVFLATGGDDYALVCAAAPAEAPHLLEAVRALGIPAAAIGRFLERPGVAVMLDGAPVTAGNTGWRH